MHIHTHTHIIYIYICIFIHTYVCKNLIEPDRKMYQVRQTGLHNLSPDCRWQELCCWLVGVFYVHLALLVAVRAGIHPASRGVAAHTADLFWSVTGAKGGVDHEDQSSKE